MKDKFDFIEEALAQRQHLGQRRQLLTVEPGPDATVSVDGRTMINFCSNDYLGLSRHPLVKQRAAEYLMRYGCGSTASRLVCGNQSFFEPVEARLAELKGTESALIFNSGFQANVSILPALADRDSLILSDQLNHNSLIQGARLGRCHVEVFKHNDPDHLHRLLVRNQHQGYSRILIATESVFSMDGDLAPLDDIVAMADTFGAILVVDEAHATGVVGPRGMGLSCGKGVDVVIGTFSKACGGFGAYVACSRKIRDYLINCCSGIIYSTALPPAVMGAIDAALELIPTMESERQALHEHAQWLRNQLTAAGWDCGASRTQIVPVISGRESDTLELSRWLAHKGIFASAIRPPTVEKGKSRIRLTVTALHERSHIEQVADAFKKWNVPLYEAV